MKNLKIAMILVAAVAFFCSCGDPEAPTVTLTGEPSVFELAKANEINVDMNVKVDAPKGIDALKGNVYYLNASDSVMDASTFALEGFTAGEKTYEGTIKTTLKKEDVKDYAAVKFEVVATTKNDVEGSANFTVTIEAPKYTTGNFEWKRLGGAAATGLADFGLSWTSSGKTVTAKIVPTNGAKLYILAADDYAIETITDLNAKLTSEVNEYRGVNAEAPTNKTYNDVIATVYDGKTYLINVTKSVGTVETAGNQIIVTGTYKAFENAVAAK
ncbi:MAG: hypothetical protein J6T48_05060 [Bacteroidales bacterium]|nr:hypothetical protein [Bacteroidales bacterium]